MNQDIIKKLQAPFPFEEVEAKIQITTSDKAKGMAVFFIDSRAIQKRLDEVLGPFGWKNQYYSWQNNAQLCGVSLYDDERGEWIEKQDGASNSDIEPIKGGLSDSFKRASCVWGIGRYLYQISGIWCEIEQRGKGSYIKDNQQGKLKTEYDKAVSQIFGAAASQSGSSAGSFAKQTPASPASQTVVKEKIPQSSLQPGNDNQSPATASHEFTVKTIKPSGKSSQMLELISGDGEVIKAYIRIGDQSISSGSCLRKVQMERKQSSYGEYNLINAYQIAA